MPRTKRARGGLGGRMRRTGEGRLVFWLYFSVAVTFIFLEALGTRIPGQVRSIAADAVAPLLAVLEQPIRGIQDGVERLAGVSDIYLENQSLRDENDRLRQWREAARRLVRENEQLRRILNAPGPNVPTAATGRVVGIGGGAFERSILLNVGRRNDVKLRQPVVSDTGVIGRIVGVGQWSSRVLLISDLNSRIPVRVERTGHLAVAEGRNSNQMQLTYLPQGAAVRTGDRLLTSGHGGVFPPDLAVGRVTAVAEEGITVEALALLDRLDYVKVMDYRIEPPEQAVVTAPASTAEGEGP